MYWTRPNDIGSRRGGTKITTPKTMPEQGSGASSGMTVTATRRELAAVNAKPNDHDDDALYDDKRLAEDGRR